MITNFDIMKYLEKIRIERKITIQEITSGIVSRRNYSRFLSDEASISFEILQKILKKMQLSLQDFSYYIHNHIMYENEDEILFNKLIRSEKYEDAYEKYYHSLRKKEYKSILANKTIPIGMKMVEYKMNFIHKAEALHYMKLYLNLDGFLKSYIIQDDDIESLYIYIRICNEEEKEIIANELLNIVLKNNRKFFTVNYERVQILMYLIVLICLTTKEKITYSDHLNIKKVTDLALEFNTRAKLRTFDVILFKTLYKYIKRSDSDNKHIIFHYIASIISSVDDEYVESKIFEVSEEDFKIFLECLDDKKLLKGQMYNGLITYGNI